MYILLIEEVLRYDNSRSWSYRNFSAYILPYNKAFLIFTTPIGIKLHVV